MSDQPVVFKTHETLKTKSGPRGSKWNLNLLREMGDTIFIEFPTGDLRKAHAAAQAARGAYKAKTGIVTSSAMVNEPGRRGVMIRRER